jgi:hypothetical protein
MKLNNRLTVTFILAALLLVALIVPGVLADNGQPQPGTVSTTSTVVMYPATALSATGTVYSASPRQANGQDVSKVRAFNSADVFVTVDISGTAAITVTPQFSPDQVNWADAKFPVISGTTVSLSTQQMVLSADGSAYLRLPVAGEFMRVKIESTGALTPTVQATLRNN